MTVKIPTSISAFCLVAAALAATIAFRAPHTAHAASSVSPTYTPGGALILPANYREWIYLTTGIDMSYTPKMEGMGDHPMFDNLFVNPESYRSYLETGTWPDKTVLVLEAREARSKGSINRSGHYQSGGIADLEFHLKDEARFPGKWAFFSLDSASGNATLIPQAAPCYSCHLAHAAVDTTFVQFYPTLLPIAQKKGTLSEAFLKEEAASGAGK
ncbi:MAG: cytochrome P460 family protein [Terracidiphilus sp.]